LDFAPLKYGIVKAMEYSKFQSSQKDLTFLTHKQMQFEDIKAVLDDELSPLVKNFYLIDEFESEELGSNKSLTLRFVLQKDDGTLEDKEIKETMETIMMVLSKRLGLELR